VVLHLDLKDFFPSIHFGRVRGMLIAFGYAYPVASALAALMTEAPRQPVLVDGVRFFPPIGPRACPQGAPTSPGLSNAIVVRMDRRLAGLARRFGFAYTRYADDLAFSGDDVAAAHALRCLAARIVHSEGFALNRAKTRVMRAGTRQAVTGVVVNQVLGLSRDERRRLRAALHRQRQAGAGQDARLAGKLGYLHMLNPAQAARLASQAAE
jgi:retron-type reverse transcriptase